MTDPTPARPGRMRALDGLRLVAALAVLLFHFTAREHVRWGVPPDQAFPHLSEVTRYGYAGVHLFFVVSGFVVLMSAWGRSLPAFVASRVSRIFPAYWAAVLLVAGLRAVWPGFQPRDVGEVAVNLTMLQDPLGFARVDGVYWTLWVELQFYVAVAVLVLVGVTARRVLVLCAVAPPVCTLLSLTSGVDDGLLTLVGWTPMFAAGMALFVVHREGGSPARWAVVALCTAQGAALAAVRKAPAIDALAPGTPVSPGLLAAVVAGCVALVAVAVLVPRVRDLDHPGLTTAGALTYPLYLTHQYVGWALIQVLHPRIGNVAALAVAVAGCLLLARGVHVLVERPVQRPLRRAVQSGLDRVRTPYGPRRAQTVLPEPRGRDPQRASWSTMRRP